MDKRRPTRPLKVALAAGALTVAYLAVRRMHLRWGAADSDLEATLPGDDLLPSPQLTATRAITIDAPVADVWPWIAQMGQGRGGLYSYDRLENLAGCDIHSTDRIESQWQDVRVGDAFRLHPQVALSIAAVDPPRSMVVRSPLPAPGEPGAPYEFTWAFVLEPAGPASTRLIVRERYRWAKPPVRLLVEPLAFVSFVMTQKMMRGVRDRAQRLSLAGTSRV